MDVLQYYVIFEFETASISGLLPGFYWEQAFSPRLGSAPSLFMALPVGSGYSLRLSSSLTIYWTTYG